MPATFSGPSERTNLSAASRCRFESSTSRISSLAVVTRCKQGQGGVRERVCHRNGLAPPSHLEHVEGQLEGGRVDALEREEQAGDVLRVADHVVLQQLVQLVLHQQLVLNAWA